MKNKVIFDRMIEMEIISQQNPNRMLSYEILWKALKEEIQFNIKKI
jgi:hypothetical protein